MSLPVVGAQYPNSDKKAPTRLFAIGLCRPGDPVHFMPEPKNPKDPRAIMVLNEQGMMMGYLPAEKVPLIHKMWREGREIVAVFQAPMENGAWVRVSFNGEEPALPEQRSASMPKAPQPSAGQDWWPDPTYDDE